MNIERAANGWIVTNRIGIKTVHATIENALKEIYHGVYADWRVGDKIVIQREPS